MSEDIRGARWRECRPSTREGMPPEHAGGNATGGNAAGGNAAGARWWERRRSTLVGMPPEHAGGNAAGAGWNTTACRREQ